MYRVLFATNEPAVLEPLNQITNWQSMSFHDPMLAGNADEAIRLMESKRVDAIAYMLDADEARKLSLYLNNMRPSLPIFQIQRTLDAQRKRSSTSAACWIACMPICPMRYTMRPQCWTSCAMR